jgi:hypothetical protein
MQATHITLRRLACATGVALAALAALTTGASGTGSGSTVCASTAQECMTAAEFRAVLIRSEALNRKHGLGTTD